MYAQKETRKVWEKTSLKTTTKVQRLAAGGCGSAKFVYAHGKVWEKSSLKTTNCLPTKFLPGKFPTHTLLNAGKCFKEILLCICPKPMFFLGRPLLEAGC